MLVAIYNVFDGQELLYGSMKSLNRIVDKFIIVYQEVSNFGEPTWEVLKPMPMGEILDKVILLEYKPTVSLGGFENEKRKRQLGIDKAKELNATHFLNIDCDEFYENPYAAWKQYLDSGKDGSVCKIFTYFKKPTWRYETEDGYYVPFIHKLHPHTRVGDPYPAYPFYVDPTRNVNTQDVILLDVHMHHYSWVRLDIERKCRNSSAKDNIANGTMLKSYYDPECGPGYYVKDADKKLIEVPNIFNL